MTKVVDPDTLDRFQVAIDAVGEVVSLRGLGAVLHAVDQTGDTNGSTTFTDAGADFVITDGIAAGDLLAIISDPAADGGIIGHYRVVTSAATTLVVDRAIAASTAADLTYAVHSPQTAGAATPQLADGVNGQALYSFMKEEWITLAAGLGGAVDLNAFDFPVVLITPEQQIFGGINGDAASAWTFAADNGIVVASNTEGVPRELMRDVGWQERNAADVVLREYANFTTLGLLDTDTQATFQQGDATGDPTNFKLLGVVNEAVLTLGPDVPPADTTNLNFSSTTITRTAGDWTTDNYRLGDRITIRAAEDAPNNGNFGPITAISSTVITIASASFTVNAADTAAIVQVDHRRYTALRARKKGRSYAKAVHVDAGIPTTGIEALLNKFPLAHAVDPAIANADDTPVVDDGTTSGGNGTAGGDIFQTTENHTTGSDGVTSAAGTGDTFTLTSAGSSFNSVARTIEILRPGDSLELTSGSDQGVYEIVSIDSATVLTLRKEPLKTYTGGESTLSFTARTGVKDTGATNATLANVDGLTGTLTSAASTFGADDGLGDRTIVAGDIVEVLAGTNAVLGYYKVVSQDSATVLTLNTADQIFSGETSQTYRIWRAGMFLQRFEFSASIASATNVDFDDTNPDEIDRTGGSWITDGFLDGMALTVVAAEDTTGGPTGTGNLQTFIIATVDTATEITLIAEEAVVDNLADTTASVNGNITGDSGIVRTINGTAYPFHWRLFANGGTLQQVFQFLQHELRRATDIDAGSGTERGDITDLLMTFASPNGVTLDLFPVNLATSELNNVTYTDISADTRSNAFLVGVLFDMNANFLGSTANRLTAYFTTNPGGNFGTNSAIIVDDDLNVDMDFLNITVDQQSTFDYTNNAQGGRTPDSDAGITVVAIGDDGAQHVLVTTTITRINSITISVPNPLERNFSNP